MLAKLSVEQSLMKANFHVKKGEVADAQRLYQAILMVFPTNKRAQQGLADLNKLNQKNATQSLPQKVVDELVNLYNQRQLSAVIEQAQALTEQHPEAFILWNLLGVSAAQMGMLDKAIESYKKCISLKPDYADTYSNMGNALQDQGKLVEAIEAYNKALLLKPDYAEAYLNIGNALQGQGKLVEAIEAYNKALLLKPDYAEAYSNMGVTLKKQGKLDEAIEVCTKSISIKPNYADPYINMGVALKDQGKLVEAIEAYNKALLLKPDYAEAYINMGNALQDQGKLDNAIEAYNKALLLKPDYAEAYLNIGNALQGQGKLVEAIEAYNKALLLKPDYAEAYSNMGVTLKKQGKLDEAIEVCTKSISIKPNYADPYLNIGNSLKDQGKLVEAIEAYNKALLLKPDYAEAYINMGNALQDQGKLDNAIEAYNKALLLKPDYAEAYLNIGNSLKDQGKLVEAIEAYNKALLLKPDYEVARVNKLLNQASICDWTGVEEDRKLIPTIGIKDQYINPGIMATFEDAPERNNIRTELYAKSFKQKPIPMPPVPMQKPKRLRIGYFSSDFRAHSVIHTLADVFDAHDREHFEIYGYSFGPNDDSKIRKRIINTIDVFHDVKEMADKDIALLARQDKIDIAIDINGYSKLCRPGIFAYRAAPIQIHFWGSANTSNTDFIDYYITDNIGIPEEHEHHWSESIIRLPFWCQARHENNYVSDQLITRKDMGLPEHGFVFCSFNNSYKLSPIEFDIWMRLLDQVENSVLWLLKSNKWIEKNLQHEARKRGVAADRLVFAEKVPHPVHLARQKLADVFVDNFNVNAGVTLGDALWVGLPVVTKLGKQMAARVGGMALTSIDMPELITKTELEYEALLLELATNSQRLSAIKEKLLANRLSTPLFNSKLFTKHLENGYQQAYQRYFDGKNPEAISVPVILIQDGFRERDTLYQ